MFPHTRRGTGRVSSLQGADVDKLTGWFAASFSSLIHGFLKFLLFHA